MAVAFAAVCRLITLHLSLDAEAFQGEGGAKGKEEPAARPDRITLHPSLDAEAQKGGGGAAQRAEKAAAPNPRANTEQKPRRHRPTSQPN